MGEPRSDETEPMTRGVVVVIRDDVRAALAAVSRPDRQLDE